MKIKVIFYFPNGSLNFYIKKIFNENLKFNINKITICILKKEHNKMLIKLKIFYFSFFKY